MANNIVSSTPYDDAFRTLVTKGGNLIIPFINEMFRGDNPLHMNAKIILEANEFFMDLAQGVQEKNITDAIILINGQPYHIECQTNDDGTILVRIAKYDWLAAMRHSIINGNTLDIPLPNSGLLYLRKTDRTPEQMYIRYYTTDGRELKYPVKVVCLADYTLDHLIKKDLLFLMPFYLFNLEKELKTYSKNSSRQKIISSYDELIQCLNNLQKENKITVYQYSLITEMLKKVTDNLARKNEKARKELDDLMGGKILEFKNEKVFNEGGINELLAGVHDGGTTLKYAIKRAREQYGMSEEEFRKRLDEYESDEDLMQG